MNTPVHADTREPWAPTRPLHSGSAELVRGRRSSQKDSCCTVQGLSGGLCASNWRLEASVCPSISGRIASTSSVNLKSQQTEPKAVAQVEGGHTGLIPRPGRSWGVKAIGRGCPRRVRRLRGHWRRGLSWEAGELRLCWVGGFVSWWEVGGLLRITRTRSPAPHYGVSWTRGVSWNRRIARLGQATPLWRPRVTHHGPGSWLR